MKVKDWMTGKSQRNAKTGSGYYIKLVNKKDRDKFFQKDWKKIHIKLLDGNIATSELTNSFWKFEKPCLELRDKKVGKWMIHSNLAPWREDHPPMLELVPLNNETFFYTNQIKQ